MHRCHHCHKPQDQLSISLKHCAKCHAALYCSRKCQTQHWKEHKKYCAFRASQAAIAIEAVASGATPEEAVAGLAFEPESTAALGGVAALSQASTAELRFDIDKPFTALGNGTWLRDRPEADVHQLLCDVFRMRREDKYKPEQEVDEGSAYTGGSAESELRNYRTFLERISKLDDARKVEERLLPLWWSDEALERCMDVATKDEFSRVDYAVEKQDIQEFYQKPLMPMQLRIFGEALDGTLVNGKSGAQVLGVQLAAEEGRSQVLHLDLS